MSKYLPDQSTIHCKARLNRLRGFLLVFASIVGVSISSFGQGPSCGCEDLMTLCSEGNDSSCDTWVTWCDFESYCDCMETLDDEAWCTMQFPPVTFCVNVDECQVASVSVSGPSSADMSSAPIVFSAQGFTQGGSPINGNGTWTWSTTNGTINGNGSTGYLYPTTSGTVQVTATFQESTQNCGPVSGSTSIAITDICPATVSVSGPSTAEYWNGLPVGPYTAQAYTQSFAPVSGGTWVWSSTNGAMSGSGAVAYLYPASPGTATVGATVQVSGCGNASGSMPVNIVCPSVSVSITGPSVVLAGGGGQTYTASVSPSMTGSFQWSLSNPAAGTLNCSADSCVFTPGSTGQLTDIRVTFIPATGCPQIPTSLQVAIVRMNIKEVSFSGTKYHVIRKDDGSQDYTAPHWQDNSSPLDGDADDSGDRKYPIAFTRNSKMKASVKWRIEPSGIGVTVRARGDGPGNLDFPDAIAALNGNDVTITNVEAANPFVNEVDYFDPMSITWSMSFDGGTTWVYAGTSINQAYITLGDPVTTVYHTLVDLGCKNADGQSSPSSTADAVYGAFTGLVIHRLSDNKQMTYWFSNQMGATETAGILQRSDANGNCQAWSALVRDSFRVQGIAADRVRALPVSTYDQSILVKNWQINDPPHGSGSYPYIVGTDASDLNGIPGQGNPNPPGAFNGHWVTLYNGCYYDGSYGTPKVCSGGKAYEDGSLDGYGDSLPPSAGTGIRRNDTSPSSSSELDYQIDN